MISYKVAGFYKSGHHLSICFVIFVFCLISVFAGCVSDTPIKNEVQKSPAVLVPQKVTKLRMAVVGFDVAASTYGLKQLDRKAEDMLTTALIKTKQFTMIDRKHIKKVIDEQAFQISGMVDTATAVKIGKILGAQAIVTGSITEMGCRAVSFIAKVTTCRASMDVQVISVETAEIIAAETGEGTSKAVIHYDARRALEEKDAELWVSESLRSAADDVAKKIVATILPKL
jgi:curli biogenesis system outer membrane secretion channel CsgG